MNDKEAFERYSDPANLEPAGPARPLPRKPLTSHVPVRFPPETIDQIKQLATRSNRTVSAWIRMVVEEAVAEQLPKPQTGLSVVPISVPSNSGADDHGTLAAGTGQNLTEDDRVAAVG